ncbi:hypothetical protein [Streptomyces malaysiensis]|uniref:hypothetical protein n=1 Tax=Streptomyces malaysiensis TaxID=92644 RepID=UPI00142ECAAD|nr:hypothetical protein [Streptomyces malaysiensis]
MDAIDGGRVVVGDDDLQAVQMFGCHLEQGGVHLAQPFQVDAFVADAAADAVNDQKVGQRVAIIIERHLLVGQGMGLKGVFITVRWLTWGFAIANVWA